MEQQLSVDTLRRIDAACDRFEEEWRSGRQPRLEDYLRQSDVSVRGHLLESLQKLQQELILQQLGQEAPGPAEVTPPAVAGEPRPVPQVAPAARPPDDEIAKTLDWNGAQVTLRVVEGPHQGQEFIYSEYSTLLVGRSTQAQLRLNEDLHFSRNHFRLEVNPPTCYLMDLNSRNGTFVNGARVADRFLQDGDLVSGGRTKMKVSIQTSRPAANETPTPPMEVSKKNVSIRAAPAHAVSKAPVSQGVPPATLPDIRAVVPPAREVPSEAQRDDGEPVHINGYEIHEQIGAGDLGKMYRATRMASGEQCALKVISPAARVDEKAIQTFLREASILNQLQHANIVRLIEMGASGTNLFLSTEYLATVQWRDLAVRSSTAQRIRIACGLMVQVLAALEYAHARALVHRDVKPGNILIYRTGGKLAAKLADFGLAKQYTTAGMSQVTREGDVIGSLPYMSPEQFINSREAKPGCDIYSAGATLYWMLTGHEPIVLENHPCKFLAILEDPPVPLAQRCPEAPPPLAQLVHRALDKSPEKRFASAAEMRQQLRAFIK